MKTHENNSDDYDVFFCFFFHLLKYYIKSQRAVKPKTIYCSTYQWLVQSYFVNAYNSTLYGLVI